MSSKWRSFLKEEGAEFDTDTVASFGNPDREMRMVPTGLVLCDLNHYTTIKVSGDDNADFLQGQLTNDIKKIDEHHSQLSGYCSQKGRLLALFRIFRHGEDLYLKLPQELYDETVKRLRMFVLRSKVVLEDTGDNLISIGLSGPEADERLRESIGQIPENIDDVIHVNGLNVIRIAGLNPRFEIYGDDDSMIKLWQQLDVHAAPAGASAWNLLDIEAGLPNIYNRTKEAFVPQMVNLELINGVSFQKGCYTGQEIVARMHYLGKLKRRMYHIQIDTHHAVNPGNNLYSPDTQSGQGTGAIVDAQPSPDGGYEALAVIQIVDAEQGGLRLNDASGPNITLLSLPYDFPPEKQQSS